jgi:hypothetical protein
LVLVAHFYQEHMLKFRHEISVIFHMVHFLTWHVHE